MQSSNFAPVSQLHSHDHTEPLTLSRALNSRGVPGAQAMEAATMSKSNRFLAPDRHTSNRNSSVKHMPKCPPAIEEVLHWYGRLGHPTHASGANPLCGETWKLTMKRRNNSIAKMTEKSIWQLHFYDTAFVPMRRKNAPRKLPKFHARRPGLHPPLCPCRPRILHGSVMLS